MFSIGEISRRSGVKVPTIRYYEQQGLIEAPDRSDGNQRRYEPAELQRLLFIRHARDLGMTIETIRELLELSGQPDRPCDRADIIAAENLRVVREKIARLRRLETELARISSQCSGSSVRDCYVIQALGSHDMCADEH